MSISISISISITISMQASYIYIYICNFRAWQSIESIDSMLHLQETGAGIAQTIGKPMGNPWENHGKTMGKCGFNGIYS